ncbi:MAG: alpha/beta fold hydrolase [Acidobacteriota bacterium]
MRLCLVLASLFTFAAFPQTDKILKALQRGGHVIVMRHASSPRELPAKETAVAGNWNQERQLDEAGRLGAAAMGVALRRRKIPISAVFSSPTFRAQETAKYAQLLLPKLQAELGDGGQNMGVATTAQVEWLREFVRTAPRGGNTVAITHQQNIAAAFPNVKPLLAEGEALVFRPGGADGTTLLGRIKVDEWGPALPEPKAVVLKTDDGGTIHGDLYGAGARGVVLAHGGRFNKETWIVQARELEAAGYRVLAIDFRGYGESTGPGRDDPMGAPLWQDVLAAARHLRANGAKTVAVVGGSMGGDGASGALVHGKAGEIDRVVLIASEPSFEPEKLNGPKLNIVCRDDIQGEKTPRLPGIRAKYDRMPEPKELIILPCSAHAQFIFQTDQGPRLMREILRFLANPN